jgi:hypothetical protein
MDILTQYENLLKRKQHSVGNHGIEPNYIPDEMFPFQKYVTEHAIRKGRCAGFIDTGLGKTYIEMVIAKNYAKATGKPVLIITPLAVAFQFIKEAAKFGIDDIQYSKDGKFSSMIVVCNYERLSHFNTDDYDCVILDESSILKNFDGSIKAQITSFLRLVKYRFLFTATPSPNDFVELGTSSEALGYLGYTDMLTKFFTNNEDTISPQKIGVEWVLKGHAKENFFKWVSGWSISMRKPSDLGFDDTKHILPKLRIQDHAVINKNNMVVNGQAMLFPIVAKRQSEVQAENRATIKERCEYAAMLAEKHERTVYWCNLNPEGDLLEELDKNAVQIYGSLPLEKKEEILLAFSNDEIKKLITKAKITAFGLNWQHCNHTVYFPNFSYERWYQAVRRFWRFGQQSEVIADRVYSDGQKRVIDSLNVKMQKADELFTKLNSNLNQKFDIKKSEFDKPVSLPSFLKA